MTSYHEYNKYDKAKVLVEKMQQGQSVAVITDAGTPGISDPGEELVRPALAEMCIRDRRINTRSTILRNMRIR